MAVPHTWDTVNSGQFSPGVTHAPPGAPVAPPPQGGGPFGSDPGYQAALANEQLGIPKINTFLQDALTRGIVNFGDPSFASKYGLDPAAAAAADQNTSAGNSVTSRLRRQHQDNLQAIINQLASHGILFSGDTGYRSGREDQTYGNTLYDAQQALIDSLNQQEQQAAQQKDQLHQGVIQALQSAYQNYLNHPELGGYGANTGATGVTGATGLNTGITPQMGTAAKKIAAHLNYGRGLLG